MTVDDVLNTLKVSPRELETILADLNRATNNSPAASRRALKRWPLQQQKIILTIIHGANQKVHGVAVPRNLSKSGAAVVYGSFIHPGTKCYLTLRCVSGGSRSIECTVRHCRHVKGRVHDVGLKFETSVEPRDFFIVQGTDYLFNCERVDVEKLAGKILIAEDSVATQRLLAHDLRAPNLSLVFARSGDEAMSCMTENPDLIFLDYSLPDTDGIKLTTQMRDAGYSQPIVLMTAEKDLELRFAAIGAGANEMLFKPIPREHLHRAIAEYLGELSVGVENAGTHSQAASDRLSQDDIDSFVDSLTELAQKLQELLEGSKADEIRAKVLELSTTAQQYGFGTVAFQAGEVMKLLDSSGGLQRASADVRRLIRICEKAHAPTRRAPAE